MSGVKRASFVVRVVQNGQGQVSGVIERVATGAKEAFHGHGGDRPGNHGDAAECTDPPAGRLGHPVGP